MQQLIAGMDELTGVIHLDQPTDSGLIQAKPADSSSRILRTKMAEAETLLNALLQSKLSPRNVVLCAENLGEGGIGKAEQGAAYYFLDQLALLHSDKLPVTAVEWGTFSWGGGDSGQAVSVIEAQLAVKRERFGMLPHECADALAQPLTLNAARVVVATRDYMPLVEQQGMFTAAYLQNQLQDEDDKGGHGRPDLDSEYVPPGTQVETLITEIWENHFDIKGLGVNDNFFALGGHSLLAVQLISKLNETFSTSIAMEHFFNAPTITELATLITEAGLDEEEAAGLEAMLDEIEGLSEEEIQSLLDQT
jgi:acyl carrier protein